ncbi:uridine kinase family protein [Aureispira anguillae]|uniref:Uridine kinase n=1 Tax=Aureispira anguillae TaxID=2864201 RepID=A0A916DTK2_9BACT|nr:uridine kinase [Aureispira anguillae]BDS12621.1 uridine kinase [Aureispira anguillae]
MQKPFLIGLTGVSGSGKTTFLKRLETIFGKDELCVISQDNYYKPREEQLIDDEGIRNFDLPTSINRAEFYQDILELLAGKTVVRQEYTFNNDLAVPKMLEFPPCPIILIEGIFIYHYKEIKDLMDLKLFLHVKETTALSRRIRRDRIERNYPLEDVLYRYKNHVLPTYERYIKPFQYEADLIINNSDNFDAGLNVVVTYLQSVLKTRKG